MSENERITSFIESLNKYTEISIAPIDGKWEWNWRCKESEGVFDSPEGALTDCINFICRDYETLLVASLAEEESVEEGIEEKPIAVE